MLLIEAIDYFHSLLSVKRIFDNFDTETMQIFTHFGRYCLLLARSFSRPERYRIFWKRILEEIELIGLGSLPIVAILSVFMGAVILIQSANSFSSPWVPLYAEGVTTRDSMILEFSSTIISMVLAGKVGSSIAGQIGTMRVTEQIDAMEIMGVNPPNYLIFPKVVAAVFIFPFLVVLSIGLGILGGFFASVATELVSIEQYKYGIQYDYIPYYLTYALIKSLFFAFIITTISSYQGYITVGGAKEVGASSTKAVVYSCIVILLFDVILTQLLLSPGA